MLLKLDKSTISIIQDQFSYIPFQKIKQFINKFPYKPVDHQENLFSHLYQALIFEYRSKLDSKSQIDAVRVQIVDKATPINLQFAKKLDSFLQSEFFKNCLKNELILIDLNEKSISKNSIIAKQTIQKNTFTSLFSKVDPNSKINNQRIQNNLISKQIQNKMLQICPNLIRKPQCLCDNPKQIEGKQGIGFKCIHCNQIFHTTCMKKKTTSQYCCFCHLERISPLKKVVGTVYVGLLKKSKNKHNATFIIPELQPNQKLQVRCLRIKQDSQYACLFPDVAEISINGRRCNIFEPINKQSCLKYRKDQPFILLKGDYDKNQQNTLSISENIMIHREKDIRRDPQNHIIGLYIVEEIKIQQIIYFTKIQNTQGFSESESILKSSFGLGKDDQITCQIVKIPILCPLTTSKIDIPARGFYCTHFQCFDLKNYLTLISESQNPRWKCPLCGQLAYQLKIDSILTQVIKQTRKNDKIKQILFFKNGDYTPLIEDQPAQDRKNIRDLGIPQKAKSKLRQQPEQQQRKPRKRPQFIIPANANIISIDD